MKFIIITLSLFFSLTSYLKAQTLKDEWVTCKTSGCKILDPYYKDGVTLKWEGSCLDGKADGYGKLIKYQDGEYESTYEGEYNNGLREGKGKFTHKDGTVREGIFINGQMCGKGIMTLTNGQKYIGDFLNYRAHGDGIIYFPNGAKFEGFCVSDRMYTGKFTNFDGNVTFIQEYNPVEKIIEIKSSYKPVLGSRVTEFFDEDWKRCKQNVASYYRLVTYESDNKPKGSIRNYYISGQLQSEFTLVYLDYEDEGKNFHEGEATWYFENGKLQQKRYYYNNNINGKNTFYYENGQISQEANYNYGLLNGVYKQWYKTGKPKIIANYDNGVLLDNKFIEYDENGLGSIVYNENFSINSDRWIFKDKSTSSIINKNNELELILYENELVSRFNYIPLEQTLNYSIESVIQKKEGVGTEGYGLVFGFKDWDNYYVFVISEAGTFSIFGKFEGLSVKIAEWKQSTMINKNNQRNLLKIMKLDNTFIFSINGNIVLRTESKELRGNYFGIISNGKGKYILENIMIKEFIDSSGTIEKKPKIIPDNPDEWKGNGSGFFISTKGYIATNYHVIKDADNIQVEYYQKGVKYEYKAKVVVTDKQNDLAIIQINDSKFKNLPFIPYVFSSNIQDVGTEVFALGYPIASVMGSEIKFTDGKISSRTGIKGDVTVYQISVPIQPGNSGGPLFDSKGNLVGITSSALNKEYFNSENVNYAIKTTYLKNLIEVMPENINLPEYHSIYDMPLTEKIKLLSDYIPIIRVK
jgi:S1-C subfamily serine protease/antitoxin component YwqK of YwqJK toxin-antitoxin module